MRLFEIAPTPRSVVATTPFISEYTAFAHKYPGLEAKLIQFLQFRQTARPDQPFNDKDSPMTDMGGVRRCHLVHGKAILIYRVSRDEIALLRLVEHDAYEGRGNNQLKRYVASLSANSLQPFSVSTTTPKPKPVAPVGLTSEQKEELVQLFKTLASGNPKDREVLLATASGDINEFLDFARIVLRFDDTSHDKAILQALGGRDMVVRFAKRWAEASKPVSESKSSGGWTEYDFMNGGCYVLAIWLHNRTKLPLYGIWHDDDIAHGFVYDETKDIAYDARGAIRGLDNVAKYRGVGNYQGAIRPVTIEQMREHIPKALESQQARMFPRRIPSSEKSRAVARYVEKVPDLLGLVRNRSSSSAPEDV
jgi:hypothetical protein